MYLLSNKWSLVKGDFFFYLVHFCECVCNITDQSHLNMNLLLLLCGLVLGIFCPVVQTFFVMSVFSQSSTYARFNTCKA